MTHTTSADARCARRTVRGTVAKTIAVLATAVLGLGAAGCGGSDSTTAPDRSYVGVYALHEVNQAALPVQIYNGSARDDTDGQWYEQFVVTIKTGTLELDGQGRYHTSFDYTLVHDGTPVDRTLEARGTYEVEGNKIHLLRDNGVDRGSGTMQNGAVTLYLTLIGSQSNQAYTYRK